MSYIPKYILKRMIPNDAVKEVAGGIEISIVNVISPISIDEIPDNLLEYLELEADGTKMDNDLKKKIKITYNDKAYSIENAKELVGLTIPVGAALKIFAPAPFKKGEKHKVCVTIKTNNPMTIEVEREVV
jgi:hypothetical protein